MNDTNAGDSGVAPNRPLDLASALKQIAALQNEVATLKQLTAQQQEEIRILKERQYGRRSEKLSSQDIRQGKLFNEAEMLSTPERSEQTFDIVRIAKMVYTRKKRGRKPLSATLARVEVIVDIDEDEKRAVPAGYELAQIGEKTSEQVHRWDPAEICGD